MENRSGNATAFHTMDEDASVFVLTRNRTATHDDRAGTDQSLEQQTDQSSVINPVVAGNDLCSRGLTIQFYLSEFS